MTKSKIEKKRSVELKLTGVCHKGKDRMARIAKRRKLGERRAWLRALREDIVIHPGDVKPGDVIEIRKVRPRKRRDRCACKWRVHYDDSGNGYMILAQEGNYYKECCDNE